MTPERRGRRRPGWGWRGVVLGAVVLVGALASLLLAQNRPHLTLAWDPPAQDQLEDAWGLYRRDGPGEAFTHIATLASTLWTWTDTDVKRRRTYCYVITARAGSQESPPGTEACGTVQ